jgi:hypothetical protein
MRLKVVIEANQYMIDIPYDVLREGQSFFDKMDYDMNKGWQMGREWVEAPTLLQRCQIAADRLADAIESGNDTLAHLTSGYILHHMPDVREVRVDMDGEMQGTRFM